MLASEAAVSAPDCIVEFGAGTGIFTRQLVHKGFRVVAIEPNAAMMSRVNVPEATWITGTFEVCPLPNDSQSWAVAAQAFHWADPQRALPEIHRILKPDCVFSVLWNNRAVHECPVLKWTEETVRRIVPEFDEAYRNREWDQVLQSTGHFRFLSKHAELHFITMTSDRYINLWMSHNRLNNIAGPERFKIFLSELRSYVQSHNIDRIDVAYHCESWSVRRLQ